ncbi:MAG: FAD-dependent oxidoreductase [Campylobacteraceae bacterium]|jgi:hypothetical protein|nr:FAD-dependent oxidoreductase [Campylobacteraceae bacterium]MBT3882411.1 FAD-dependent oxidoreductase [Campylobacteraceae bacterium]MBT4029957.1 FAD-dependent oxidoreductase [Campylobacteraceae bacterium]MBT4707763.1 FAD-dependent oxidoreductase [Campylobacteraceae bacterium]MBT5324164.1 FAD-dependent oxidoreductase [Campylobacteraceae bacterium]
MAKIAIIGGGVAGATSALYLGQLGLDITLFEKKDSLVSGPPFCHLHAGGNLYREIPNSECITLLHQSIDLLKFYPYAVDFRPTVIAIPLEDEGNPEDLLARLKILQKEYHDSILKDPSNKVLGNSDQYFKLFSKEEVEILKTKETKALPKTLDDWMIPVAKNVNLETIKFPLVIVQEYGLNLFALASGAALSLDSIPNSKLYTNTKVMDIIKDDESYIVQYNKDGKSLKESFDYIINSAGFRSGKIDDMLSFKRDRLVEFKAAYVTKWNSCKDIWPEVVFHGTRGTPQGMGQFTPYPDGYFQLHGMTKDITLFDKGLVKNNNLSSQPQLDQKFIDKIDKQWNEEDVIKRSKLAIKHLCKFIPGFCGSEVASKPLFGAQQIPGTNKELRAADVSFEGDRYARCEVVKASSVLTMIDQIVLKLVALRYLNKEDLGKRKFKDLDIKLEEIEKYSRSLSQSRGYPQSLGSRNIPNLQDNI